MSPYNNYFPCQELGVFTRNRRPVGNAVASQRFAQFLASLDFAALPAAKPDAVFFVSETTLHPAYALARKVGCSLRSLSRNILCRTRNATSSRTASNRAFCLCSRKSNRKFRSKRTEPGTFTSACHGRPTYSISCLDMVACTTAGFV